MKVLVKYVAFHPDNHQGGSGQSFEFQRVIEIPDIELCGSLSDRVSIEVFKLAKLVTPYTDTYDFKVAIQKIEVLF